MNTYTVLRNEWNKGNGDKLVRDEVQATSIEVKLEGNNAIVLFRDVEGRLTGVVHEYDAVYRADTVQFQPIVLEESTDGKEGS